MLARPATLEPSNPGIDNGHHNRHAKDMARKLRIEYPGAVYHVLNRGDRREPIFKDDAEKVAVAARLRAETTMTVGWIAERLGMGTRGHLNQLLYRRRKSNHE